MRRGSLQAGGADLMAKNFNRQMMLIAQRADTLQPLEDPKTGTGYFAKLDMAKYGLPSNLGATAAGATDTSAALLQRTQGGGRGADIFIPGKMLADPVLLGERVQRLNPKMDAIYDAADGNEISGATIEHMAKAENLEWEMMPEEDPFEPSAVDGSAFAMMLPQKRPKLLSQEVLDAQAQNDEQMKILFMLVTQYELQVMPQGVMLPPDPEVEDGLDPQISAAPTDAAKGKKEAQKSEAKQRAKRMKKLQTEKGRAQFYASEIQDPQVWFVELQDLKDAIMSHVQGRAQANGLAANASMKSGKALSVASEVTSMNANRPGRASAEMAERFDNFVRHYHARGYSDFLFGPQPGTAEFEAIQAAEQAALLGGDVRMSAAGTLMSGAGAGGLIPPKAPGGDLFKSVRAMAKAAQGQGAFQKHETPDDDDLDTRGAASLEMDGFGDFVDIMEDLAPAGAAVENEGEADDCAWVFRKDAAKLLAQKEKEKKEQRKKEEEQARLTRLCAESCISHYMYLTSEKERFQYALLNKVKNGFLYEFYGAPVETLGAQGKPPQNPKGDHANLRPFLLKHAQVYGLGGYKTSFNHKPCGFDFLACDIPDIDMPQEQEKMKAKQTGKA
ncbi:unnamed protein product [Amoebophrya sp. A25]|nr:unnamed protein product [Amoebophrya sp. A25]|eukprot:GSA25T00003014001.1